jgi:hypothetical protein
MAVLWISNGEDKMAREIKRAATIRVSVSDREKAELVKAAEKESLPFGVFVRMAALKLARGELRPA